MINYTFGSYGFLNREKMEDPPLFLLDLGVERRCKESYYWDNSTRPSYSGYLLQFTLKGGGFFEKDGKREWVGEGCGFFAKMPENSRYYLPFASDPQAADPALTGSLPGEWEFFFLHFDGPAALPFYQTLIKEWGPVFPLPVNSPPVSLFFRLFDRCRQNGLERYEGGEFLYRFLSRLLQAVETPADGGSFLLKQARNYLKEHFADLSGIGEAAGFCQVSQEHLTRCFSRETGQTPLQYLTGLRLEHGLFLLLNTDDTIEDIAKACGFLNGNYFAKVFRRYLQCSPESYRKRNRG